MESNNKKVTLTLGIISVVTLLLAVVGMTYAYFAANVIGNDKASSVNINTAKLASVNFTDGAQIFQGNILPGYKTSKAFNVATTGGNTVDTSYKVFIYWKNSGITDIKYTLTKGGTPVASKSINTVQTTYQKTEISEGVFSPNAGAQTHNYNFTLDFPETGSDQNSQQGKSFDAYLQVELSTGGTTVYYNRENPTGTTVMPTLGVTLGNAILANNTVKNLENDSMFAHVSPADKSENGLWKEARAGKTEGDKPTYFFRGSVQNNYVSFAGKMWRIVRINEDGTIKLILGGNSTEDGYIDSGSHVWYPSYNQASYVNYVGSTAKTDIDAWYNNNITGAENNKVANWNVCNDKSETVDSYGGRMRLYVNKTPQFKCPNASDNITTKGGLLTADEVAYAGGVAYSNNPDYYLYDNAKRSGNAGYWWVSSPCRFNSGYARVFFVNGVDDPGNLNNGTVSNAFGLRAAISLASDTLTVSGNGTQVSPYAI
ncbi:MAG: hypothetical protein RRZ30_02525 [Bacilli bacterium]